MAVFDQQKTTYSDTTPQVRVISDIINLIDPTEVPLVDALGGLDTARSKFQIRMNGKMLEILEDEYAPLSDVANQGTTITTNTVTITVTDASIFQDGQVIQIDAEYMVVKSADRTNNTIEVYARNYGGTNATHDTTSTIYIVGMARLEGDDADYGPLVDITAPYNYTAIYQKALNISGTQMVIDQYGITDEFMYQSNKAVPELMRQMNLAAYHGVRAAGTASAPRSFGGLGTFITDNTVNASGAIAKSDVDNLMESIYLDGGNPDLLVMHPSVANDFRALIDSSSFVRVSQDNNSLGMAPIELVRTQYGTLRLLMDRWCPVSTAYVLDTSKIGFYTLRPFQAKQLAVTGDSVKGEVVGEFSLLVANDKAHGKITGISS